jgi:hypothetical protein
MLAKVTNACEEANTVNTLEMAEKESNMDSETTRSDDGGTTAQDSSPCTWRIATPATDLDFRCLVCGQDERARAGGAHLARGDCLVCDCCVRGNRDAEVPAALRQVFVDHLDARRERGRHEVMLRDRLLALLVRQTPREVVELAVQASGKLTTSLKYTLEPLIPVRVLIDRAAAASVVLAALAGIRDAVVAHSVHAAHDERTGDMWCGYYPEVPPEPEPGPPSDDDIPF